MRAVLDACVLYPTVLREVLLGVAARGDFVPLWSTRILEEWRRAAARAGDDVARQAGVEIALAGEAFPAACVEVPVRDDLWLPDPDDVHVLAAALEGGAQVIVTANLRDFPPRAMAGHGVQAVAPDAFLLDLHHKRSVAAEVEAVRARTEAISGRAQPLRPLLKRAGLPRLARALSG